MLKVTWKDTGTTLRVDDVRKNSTVKSWTPTREDYDFVDWYKDAKLTKPFDFIKDRISLDFDAFANTYNHFLWMFP